MTQFDAAADDDDDTRGRLIYFLFLFFYDIHVHRNLARAKGLPWIIASSVNSDSVPPIVSRAYFPDDRHFEMHLEWKKNSKNGLRRIATHVAGVPTYPGHDRNSHKPSARRHIMLL